jgi:hypothetical protein
LSLIIHTLHGQIYIIPLCDGENSVRRFRVSGSRGSNSGHRLRRVYYLWVVPLDILTLWQNIVFPLPIGIWLGGLLATVVWQIGRKGGGLAANMMAVLMGLVSVPVATLLIAFAAVVLHVGGLYEWSGWLAFATIDATVFWLILLVGVLPATSFLFGFFVSFLLMVSLFLTVVSADIVGSGLFFGWLSWGVAVISREIMRVKLPEKYFTELGCSQHGQKKEIIIGHPHSW